MSTKQEYVILVDANDNETGTAEKMEAHRSGTLHRAISVFIFNSEGKWLLQKRAEGKYHSGGLWTNACCSHPRPGEDTATAAHRRLQEEMGIRCDLNHAFAFTYRAELDHDLIEHELDHIFIGRTDAVPNPDPGEVSGWKYFSTQELETALKESPDQFTEWFKLILPRLTGVV
ncbi:MAG TPA: isopentenyl-diphosphate Delta-isomerase [Bacteroidia bacterium]|nr:isopentenyl-diphosphate Delta-isomerase [Bacteroidia bacterium]